LLQLDEALIDALHGAGFEVGVETNGTIQAPPGIDWLCVSPKGSAPLEQTSGNELKLVYPQAEDEAQPARFESLEFRHFYLQPLDDEARDANTRVTIDYCLAHPQWKLSMQMHKILGID
jgi:organic radical activating enzyme